MEDLPQAGWVLGVWGRGGCAPPFSHPFPPLSSGVIKLKNNGDFFIANEGRRPIYVDGRPVLSGSKWKLNNNSVVEVSPKAMGGSWVGGVPMLILSSVPPPDSQPPLRLPHQPGPHRPHQGRSSQAGPAVIGGAAQAAPRGALLPSWPHGWGWHFSIKLLNGFQGPELRFMGLISSN